LKWEDVFLVFSLIIQSKYLLLAAMSQDMFEDELLGMFPDGLPSDSPVEGSIVETMDTHEVDSEAQDTTQPPNMQTETANNGVVSVGMDVNRAVETEVQATEEPEVPATEEHSAAESDGEVVENAVTSPELIEWGRTVGLALNQLPTRSDWVSRTTRAVIAKHQAVPGDACQLGCTRSYEEGIRMQIHYHSHFIRYICPCGNQTFNRDSHTRHQRKTTGHLAKLCSARLLFMTDAESFDLLKAQLVKAVPSLETLVFAPFCSKAARSDKKPKKAKKDSRRRERAETPKSAKPPTKLTKPVPVGKPTVESVTIRTSSATVTKPCTVTLTSLDVQSKQSSTDSATPETLRSPSTSSASRSNDSSSSSKKKSYAATANGTDSRRRHHPYARADADNTPLPRLVPLSNRVQSAFSSMGFVESRLARLSTWLLEEHRPVGLVCSQLEVLRAEVASRRADLLRADLEEQPE
jgi:hypothetical protein